MSIWYSKDEEEYDAEPIRHNEEEILEIARKVGFEDQDLNMIRKLAAEESSFISNHINPDDFGRPSYGLLQIRENNIYGTGIGNGLIDHGIIDSPDDLADPEINLIAALWVVNREGWGGKDKLKYDDRPYGKWADWRGTIEKSFDFFEEALAESEGSVMDIVDDSISNEEEVDPNRLEDPWNLDLNSNSGFDLNVLRFINDSNGTVIPIRGRIPAEEYREIYRKWDQPLRDIFGDLRTTPMTHGNAAMVTYRDNGEWAQRYARDYGITMNSDMPGLLEATGVARKPRRHSRKRQHPVARFAELAEGLLHYDN